MPFHSLLRVKIENIDYEVFYNPENANQKLYGLYYWIFPNLMLNFYSWGLSVNIIEPISPEKTRVCFSSFSLASKEQSIGMGSSLDTVELEDQSVVQSVQQVIKSKFYNQS